MKDARDVLLNGKDSEGKEVKRPLSPDLQVYRPQITTVLSIFHRISGITLSLLLLLISWWVISATYSIHAFFIASAVLSSKVGLTVLALCSVALYYHLCNGIRILFWVSGFGVKKKKIHSSGIFIVILALCLTLLTWLFIFV